MQSATGTQVSSRCLAIRGPLICKLPLLSRSARFHAAAIKTRPDIPVEIALGRFGALHTWLRENMYRHGREFHPRELIMRATGEPMSTGPHLGYLRSKYGELYRLPSLDER